MCELSCTRSVRYRRGMGGLRSVLTSAYAQLIMCIGTWYICMVCARDHGLAPPVSTHRPNRTLTRRHALPDESGSAAEANPNLAGIFLGVAWSGTQILAAAVARATDITAASLCACGLQSRAQGETPGPRRTPGDDLHIPLAQAGCSHVAVGSGHGDPRAVLAHVFGGCSNRTHACRPRRRPRHRPHRRQASPLMLLA